MMPQAFEPQQSAATRDDTMLLALGLELLENERVTQQRQCDRRVLASLFHVPGFANATRGLITHHLLELANRYHNETNTTLHTVFDMLASYHHRATLQRMLRLTSRPDWVTNQVHVLQHLAERLAPDESLLWPLAMRTTQHVKELDDEEALTTPMALLIQRSAGTSLSLTWFNLPLSHPRTQVTDHVNPGLFSDKRLVELIKTVIEPQELDASQPFETELFATIQRYTDTPRCEAGGAPEMLAAPNWQLLVSLMRHTMDSHACEHVLNFVYQQTLAQFCQRYDITWSDNHPGTACGGKATERYLAECAHATMHQRCNAERA